MRRCIAILLTLSLSVCLFGCSFSGIKEPVEFYYPRRQADLALSPEDGAIVSEMREASGHRSDLYYLLSLYLQGPLDSKLVSPFPAGTRLVEVRSEDSVLHVTLNEAFAGLTGLDLTIACACLAKTCLSMSGAEQVHIETAPSTTGDFIDLTLDRDSLLLEEPPVTQTTPAETQ